RQPTRGPVRFTPTHVGNTPYLSPHLVAVTVHPHARGEYARSRAGVQGFGGSPPRTWRIRQRPLARPKSFRFTPTHVGNTRPQPAAAPVHPHARGEYRGRGRHHRAQAGSPPRTWGIRPAGRRCRTPPRFTPTHVGNTP